MKPRWVPRPYQPACIDFIVEKPRCALWAPPGMGKTSTVLAAIDVLLLSEEITGPVLVLGPLRVAREVWKDEAAKWSNFQHLRVVPIIGTAKQRLQAVNTPADIYCTNYEQIPNLIKHYGDRWPFQMIIADESTKLKSFRLKQGGKRANLLSKVTWLPQVKRFVNLTGTPSPNGLEDLWGQTWFLDQGRRLGLSFNQFAERWFHREVRGGGGPSYQQKLKADSVAEKQIHDALRDITMSLDPKDWFDIADPIVNVVKVKLPDKARAVYKDLEQAMYHELTSGNDITIVNAAALTMKCLQLANGFVYTVDKSTDKPIREDLHDEKLEALEDIIEETGTAVLVAYNFVGDRERIIDRLGVSRCADLSTKTGMEAFKAGRVQIGVAHAKSVGHGVDGLQYVTNTLIRFGHDWNLEERMQMVERIGPVRQKQAGFDRPVYVHDIITERTVDEDVLERHKSKREVQDILLAAMKAGKSIFQEAA